MALPSENIPGRVPRDISGTKILVGHGRPLEYQSGISQHEK